MKIESIFSVRSILASLLICLSLNFVASAAQAAEEKKPVLIGLDGEFGHVSSSSAEAIRQGVQIAIGEINEAGGVLGGRPLQLVEKANASLPARSAANLKEFAALPDLVAVFCGRFSPTVLETLPLIHELKLPLLDPWAAADAIVDNGYSPNFVFRLSMKDSWAASVMLANLEKRKIRRVGLLLLNTSWGRGTKKASEDYVVKHPNLALVATQWINWDDKEDSMAQKLSQLEVAGAEAILLVANAGEAAIVAKVMIGRPAKSRLPIVSHWGVTGGDLPGLVGPSFYELDFKVVQTYSFIGQKSPTALRVIQAHNKLVGGQGARSIASPVGVAHAYDLTHILAKAIQFAKSTDRTAIRDAMEKVTKHAGLIKHYPAPFTSTRHEALSPSDVFMAKYSPQDGALERLP